MILSIHQPSYFPWLGLLDKIAKTDTFVLLDDVQVTKGTFQYRNIFFCNGCKKYITLPINYSLGITFNELVFNNDNWTQQHLDKIKNYYLKSPHFAEVYEDLKSIFTTFQENQPIDVLINSMLFCFNKLDINVNLIRSSCINYKDQKGEMVLDICNKVNTDTYLAGKGSYNYMQEILTKFKEANIEVLWNKFNHPVYEQHPKFIFLEGLSTLDLFFFQGYINAREIFWNNITTNE